MKSALKFVAMLGIALPFAAVFWTAYYLWIQVEFMMKLLKVVARLYVWIGHFIERNTFFIFKRAIRIVFVGITVAFVSLMAVILWMMPEPTVRVIGAVGCALCYATALDSIFDDHGLFATSSIMTLIPLVSVAMAAITVGMPFEIVFHPKFILPVFAIGMGFLINCWVMHRILQAVIEGLARETKEPMPRMELLTEEF